MRYRYCSAVISGNDGRDTRTIQEYLGHKSIASTAIYTRLAAERFNGLWSD